MTNIVIDDAIFRLQASGGISTLWRALVPFLHEALPDCTFDPQSRDGIFISTYYQQPPDGMTSLAVVYDYISEQYPLIPKHTPDVYWKHQAVARANAVIAISEWTAHDVQRFNGKSASVAYLATTLDRASPDAVRAFKAKYNLPDSYILISGRRGLYKNVSSYWQALRLFQSPPFTVCIGGEDEPIPNGVRLHLSEDEVSAAYTGAQCLVYPSLYEGFGLPVIEAYACGCPVICGNGGALAEINEAAYVVNVTRPREIAQALAAFQNPGLRLEHILKGYEAVKRFHWQKTAAVFASVIRAMSAERATA